MRTPIQTLSPSHCVPVVDRPSYPMEVPFLDIKAQNQSIRTELQAALETVITNAQFILGPAVEQFEANFAEYLGARYCVGVNNGTSALHLALLAAGVKPGDEVITTPHSWISTSWAISYVGARPVFVDIDPITYTLDPGLVAQAITPRTRAILPVHLYGQAADLTPLLQISDSHGLMLIEDAAQAHGSKYQGRRVGTWGKTGCFSFYPGKNLGAFGEAGAIVTDDAGVADRMRCLRDHAQQSRHNHTEIGYNMRMEGLQGAVLAVKLRHLDAWNEARTRHASHYRELLADLPELVLPAEPRPQGHVWHLFVVLVPPENREAMRRMLAAKGVQTGIHYPTPIPYQPAYAHLGNRPGDFPITEKVMASCVSLPMFAELTEDQIGWTAAALKDCLNQLHSRSQAPL